MKAPPAWQIRIVDTQIMPAPRQRSPSRRPSWIIILVSLVCLSLIGAYIFPPENYPACYFFASSVCNPFMDWLPPTPVREFTDEEIAANAVFTSLLLLPPVQVKVPKIAFLFLTPGTLPFERLWEKFFQGHEGRFSIYVHASREKPVHVSPLFVNRDIRSDKVGWGQISMVDAEKRLLANALQDADNQHFVLLSDSCVPLQNFDFVYRYLMETNISFIDCFDDPGPHGTGRYSDNMLPEIEKKDWRKGSQAMCWQFEAIFNMVALWARPDQSLDQSVLPKSAILREHLLVLNQCKMYPKQGEKGKGKWYKWFTMKRQHALIVLADNLYYAKFKLHCQPGADGRNCYADEHYLPTLFNMVDPHGIANWSVTHVDWSEGKWHPRAYRDEDATYELFKNITSIEASVHVTSDDKRIVRESPCMWNGVKKPCYLFARKFYPEALDNLMRVFSSYTNV